MSKNFYAIKVHHLPLPRCNFQTIPSLLPFEAVNVDKKFSPPSILSVKTLNKSIIAGIPSILLLQIQILDNQYDSLEFKIAALENSTISHLNQQMSNKKNEITCSYRDCPNKLGYFIPIQLISAYYNETLTITGLVSNEGKIRNFTHSLELNVTSPFLFVFNIENVFGSPILLKIAITNNAKYELKDIFIDFIPNKNYQVNQSSLKVADVLENNGIISTVFELTKNDVMLSDSKEIGNIKIKFSLNGIKYEYTHWTPITTDLYKTKFAPISVQVINFEDVQTILQSFSAELEITNNTNEEKNFQIQMIINENGVIPNGPASFVVENLMPKSKTVIKADFIALKRGFSLFPSIFIHGLSEGDFSVDIQNGVMVAE